MTHTIALGFQILMIIRADTDDERYLLDNIKPEFTELIHLVGVISQQADLRNTKIAEDASGGGILTGIGGQTEGKVRIDGVESAFRGRACR